MGPIASVFSIIDGFVSKVVNSLFELLSYIIDYDIFDTNKLANGIMDRLYIFLAIFLLFKTSVEIINFIISPDKTSSKDSGAAAFVKRIIITLVLLTSFPFIFDKANELQKEVINSGVLEKIIFGTSSMTENGTSILDNVSYNFEKNLYGGFADYCDPKNLDCNSLSKGGGCEVYSKVDPECGSIYDRANYASGYVVEVCYEEDVIGYHYVYADNDPTKDIIAKQEVYGKVCSVNFELSCRQKLMGWYEKKNYDKTESGELIATSGDLNNDITPNLRQAVSDCYSHNMGLDSENIDEFKFEDYEEEDFYPSGIKKNKKNGYYLKGTLEDADYFLRKVDEAAEKQSVSELFSTGIFAETDDNGKLILYYRVGLPTIVGVFAAIFLAFFCIDCVYRTLRLFFFEMVAPLAIATYVDHRSATSGIFSKWVRHTVMAYIELFIKFISLYLIIFITSTMKIGFYGTDDMTLLQNNPLLLLIILAAIIYFAWHLPKFLKQSLGINVESNGSYRLFKTAKEKLIKFYKSFIKVAAAIGISVATGGIAAGAAGTAAGGTAAAGAATATTATTTAATGTGAAAAATGTGAAAAVGTGTAAAETAGGVAASAAGANAVANATAQGVNQGAAIAKQMARAGIRAGVDAIKNPDKSLFNIVSDATQWSSKLRNLDAHGIGLKDRTLNKINHIAQIDPGNMGTYDKLINSLKEAEMKINDITQKIGNLDQTIENTKNDSSIPTSEYNEAFQYTPSIDDDGRYFMDMKYSSFEEYINSNSQSSMTEEMYNEFNKLLELKVQLENEERLAEAEKEEWQELLEDLDNV